MSVRVRSSLGRALTLGAAGLVLAACSPTTPSETPFRTPMAAASPTTPAPASVLPSPTVVAGATDEGIPACVPDPTATGALSGVVEQRPEGWSLLSTGFDLEGFPGVQWQVYGPTGPEVPLEEGPGRLVLYESFKGGDAYFKSRAAASRKAGGTAIAANVCGDETTVWVDETSGELLVGWTYRGKSDVLVANSVDFTVQQLIESAERVYDCCG